MSNIYIQEPTSNGKVVLSTTVGEIDVELWSKEAPKACRNFVQLCMEGYYDNTIFHRVVPDFIVQGGDPDGTGEGGESIYGAPFKDEFHSRLRFVRRGLVAMANRGPNDNESQFFFTMNQTPELMNKHTIFGKVTGQTLFNMLRLQEVEIGENERPVEPHRIVKVEILSNPFDDIIPRVIKKKKEKDEESKKVKSKSKATKNFSLLSFGEEAEEDEEETFKASKRFSGKSKSSHDLIDDPNLSSVPAMDKAEKQKLEDMNELEELEKERDAVRKKLKKEERAADKLNNDNEADTILTEDSKSKRVDDAKKETKKLQKELKAKMKSKQADNVKDKDEPKEEKEESKEKPGGDDFLEKFKQERQKYKLLQKEQTKKGKGREAQTLALLSKFQSKLSSVKQLTGNYSDSEEEKEKEKEDDEEEDDKDNTSWMRHKLQFVGEAQKRKVIDANIADLDRYEIHDPRNPLTIRRREESKKKAKQK